jgi:putative membrane protein
MQTLFFFLHMLGIVFWPGSLVTIAFVAASPTPGDDGLPQTLRKVNLQLTAPAMLLAFIGGLGMLIPDFGSLYARAGWMHAKLGLLLILAALSGVLSGRLRRWSQGQDIHPSQFGRIGWLAALTTAAILVFAVFRPI